jgi:peptidoglycan/xylan/chitin deacetylase (PgdA/CDA1 family)
MENRNMNRKSFLQAMTLGGFGLTAIAQVRTKKTHVVTLSFDDGLKKSFYKTAEIYESLGLRACLNVIAQGHLPKFRPTVNDQPDAGIVPFEKGDFSDWNALKKRGHEVMAHSFDHVNLLKIPLDEAKMSISKCADYFESHLDGFQASRSIYNFAYNASNPELEAYALTKFMAIRTQGDTPVNPLPKSGKQVRIGCWSHGPRNCDDFLEKAINDFLDSPGGWFVFNAHGLDDEGWGPMSSSYLLGLLKRLVKLDHVDVLPAGEVIHANAKSV